MWGLNWGQPGIWLSSHKKQSRNDRTPLHSQNTCCHVCTDFQVPWWSLAHDPPSHWLHRLHAERIFKWAFFDQAGDRSVLRSPLTDTGQSLRTRGDQVLGWGAGLRRERLVATTGKERRKEGQGHSQRRKTSKWHTKTIREETKRLQDDLASFWESLRWNEMAKEGWGNSFLAEIASECFCGEQPSSKETCFYVTSPTGGKKERQPQEMDVEVHL